MLEGRKILFCFLHKQIGAHLRCYTLASPLRNSI